MTQDELNNKLRNVALYGHTGTVKALLAAGADVEEAIMKAVKSGRYSRADLNNIAFNILEAKEQGKKINEQEKTKK